MPERDPFFEALKRADREGKGRSSRRAGPTSLRELLRELDARSVRWARTKRGHVKIFAPRGIVITSGTPGGGRWAENLLGELRRNGLDLRASHGRGARRPGEYARTMKLPDGTELDVQVIPAVEALREAWWVLWNREPADPIEGTGLGDEEWALYTRYLRVGYDHRGGGRARRLVVAAERWARGLGATAAVLAASTEPGDADALSFWEHFGYRVVPGSDKHGDSGVMVKELSR